MGSKIIFFLIFITTGAQAFELDLSFNLHPQPAPYVPAPLWRPAQEPPTRSLVQIFTFSKNQSPDMLKIPKITLLPKPVARQFINTAEKWELPAFPLLTALPSAEKAIPAAKTQPLIEISSDEYKMIQALLLFEKQKKPEQAFALFAELLSSPRFKTQASLHYAVLARKFELPEEFKTKLLALLKNENQPALRKRAVEELIAGADALEPADVAVIESEGVPQKTSDAYIFKKALYLEQKGELAAAERSLEAIPDTSKKSDAARLLLSNLKYRQGDLADAVKVLEKPPQGNELKSIMLLTLARLYFQKSQYKQAYATYLKIDKNSPLWLTASQEQALTQNMAGDYIGAAGNMFSLHTAYFKKAYAPESYIVRAIGYLNLCQYGDAVSVVAELDRRYSKTSEVLNDFKKGHPQPSQYYQLIRELFANPELTEVQGLARSFILDLARTPAFLNVQKRINRLEEENGKFAKLSTRLPALKKEYDKALTSTANQKGRLKEKAGTVLEARFKAMQVELAGIIEQKDILAYEIYSGAGEHIRYQMAGGESAARLPSAALTPEEKQSYKWKFRGELWEDEIGHYRSSLTSVCPESDKKITKIKTGDL